MNENIRDSLPYIVCDYRKVLITYNYLQSHELMKAPGELQQKIVSFIRNADLYRDSFEYLDMDKVRVKPDREVEKPEEKALDIPEQIMDWIRFDWYLYTKVCMF